MRDGNESVAVNKINGTLFDFLAFQQHYNFIKSHDPGL